MRRRLVGTVVGVVLVFGSIPSRAAAQVPEPGSWSVVEKQPAGTPVVLKLKSGDELVGRLETVAIEDLAIITGTGERQQLPRSLVREIVTVATRSPVGDGIVKGSLIGAGICAALLAIAYASCGDGCEAPGFGGPFAIAMAVGIGGGAGAGALVDGVHRAPLVLYRAAEPE